MGLKWAQHPEELKSLLKLIRKKECTSVLEIGSRYGHTLVELAKQLPEGSRVVSVELAGGPWGRPDSFQELVERVYYLRDLGYDARLIAGNSQDIDTIDAAQNYGPFDFILIDGDHTYHGVSTDWKNYRPMANKLVAFHDIILANGLDVGKFWCDLLETLPNSTCHEFVQSIGSQNQMGIGVVEL